MMFETFARLGKACDAVSYAAKASIHPSQSEADEVVEAYLECTKEGLIQPRIQPAFTLYLVAADQIGAARSGGDFGLRTLKDMQDAFDSMARDLAVLVAKLYFGLDEKKPEEAELVLT